MQAITDQKVSQKYQPYTQVLATVWRVLLLLTGLIVSGWLRLDAGSIPWTMQTVGVLLVAWLARPQESKAALAVYGGVIGGLFAISLDGVLLQLLFGGFLILIALQLLLYKPQVGGRSLPNYIGMAISGSGIGGVSAIFGIGGGTLTVPMLTFYGVKIHQAVGTAAACGLPIALGATLAYATASAEGIIMPQGSLGFVFIPALLGIIVASLPCARLGALLAHKVNAQKLRRGFAWVTMGLGVRFVWINITF